MNVDTRRVLRDALDKRGNHQEIHIVGRRDDETPQALRGVEFFRVLIRCFTSQRMALDWIDQGQRPDPLASCRTGS